ncbi:MAG TPA: TIGR03943 family protein [Actinomycetota bacterium]|nr:TIGR03943 family protein [Actinomycetota bacterium]
MDVTIDRLASGAARPLKRWSTGRVAAGLVMSLWAGLFWFLFFSGRSALYLSSRTSWIVPTGAIIMTIAALGRLASSRAVDADAPTRRDVWSLALIAAPAIIVLALPPASLGSFATQRRSSFVSAGYVSSVEDVTTGELSLADVAGAVRSDEAMRALVARAGTEVSFTGFVARDKSMPADEFMLSRFVVSCCVADALAVQVRIVDAPPGELEIDQWVRVTGALYPLGREVVVQATNIEPVPRPKHPYLNP